VNSGINAKKSDTQVEFSEQIPLSVSQSGKEKINEALRSQDPSLVIEKIQEVCDNENLSKLGCVQAMFYCSKAVLAGSSEVIRGACANLIR
jgi:hypothetical protein